MHIICACARARMCAHTPYEEMTSEVGDKEHKEESVYLGMRQRTEDAPLSDLIILLREERRVM